VTRMWRKQKPEQRTRYRHIVPNLRIANLLKDKYLPPLDLHTFGKFCENEMNEDLLGFVILTRHLKTGKWTDDQFKVKLAALLEVFLEQGTRLEINIPFRVKRKAVRDIREMLDTDGKDLDRAVLDQAYRSAIKMLKMNSFQRFKVKYDNRVQLPDLEAEACWCIDIDKSCRSFFCPSVITSATHFRLTITCFLLTLIGGNLEVFFLGTPFLLLYAAYGQMARLLCGPRLDFQSFVVIFVLMPFIQCLGWKESRYIIDKYGRLKDAITFILLIGVIVLSYFQFFIYAWIVSAVILVQGVVQLIFHRWCPLVDPSLIVWSGCCKRYRTGPEVLDVCRTRSQSFSLVTARGGADMKSGSGSASVPATSTTCKADVADSSTARLSNGGKNSGFDLILTNIQPRKFGTAASDGCSGRAVTRTGSTGMVHQLQSSMGSMGLFRQSSTVNRSVAEDLTSSMCVPTTAATNNDEKARTSV